MEVMKKSAGKYPCIPRKTAAETAGLTQNRTGRSSDMKILPIAIAGVYVPGGKAAYPSSVLMNVLPAKVAGVERIIMTTPPGAGRKGQSWYIGCCTYRRCG